MTDLRTRSFAQEELRYFGAFVLLILLSAPYVFFKVYSHMSFFDDEGTLMIGFRSLLEGNRMYDEIYSLYGPLYNGLYRIIYVHLQVPLTHTGGRAIAGLLWISYSAVFALVCRQLTGSRIASLFCYVLTLVWLAELMNSPGHPEEIALLMLACLLLAIGSIANGATKRPARFAAAACAGGLVVGLALVKINVGVFAGQCLLFVLLRITRPHVATQTLTAVLVVLLPLTPVVLAALLLDQRWVQVYVAFASGTIAASLAVFLGMNMPATMSRGDWGWTVAGGLIVFLVVIGGTLLAGSSAYAVLDAVVFQNAHFLRNWFIPMRIGIVGGTAASLSICLALAYRFGVQRSSAASVHSDRWPTLLICAAKAAFLVIGLILFRSPGTFVQVLAPFCWLLMVVPAETPARISVLRGATGLLGSLLIFYAFPVAGHQIRIGALIGVIALPVFAHDLVLWARHRIGGDDRTNTGRWRLPVSAAVMVLVLGAITVANGRIYWQNQPLNLPGTAMIRLPSKQVESLRWVTSQLRTCHSSYSMPGLFSFAFWTGHALPTTLNINNVLGFIRFDQQRKIVDALRQSPDLCIVYSIKLMRFLDRGQALRKPPLLEYVQNEFAIAMVRDEYMILRRRPTTFETTKPK